MAMRLSFHEGSTKFNLTLSHEHWRSRFKEPQPSAALAAEETSRHAENTRQTMDHGGSRERGWRDHPQTPSNNPGPGRQTRIAGPSRDHSGLRLRLGNSSTSLAAVPGFLLRHRQ